MDNDTFKKHVEALATKRLEKPKKLSSQNAMYWGEIESQQYNFNRGDNTPCVRCSTASIRLGGFLFYRNTK